MKFVSVFSTVVLCAGISYGHAEDSQAIAEQVKQAIVSQVKVTASPVVDSSLSACFAAEFHKVEIEIPWNGGTTSEDVLYAVTPAGLLEIRRPTMAQPMPEFLKLLKPEFGLKTEQDGAVMLGAVKGLYLRTKKRTRDIEPSVHQQGNTWNFIIDDFF